MPGILSGRPRKDPDKKVDKRPSREVVALQILPATEQFEPLTWLGPDGAEEFTRIVTLMRENNLLAAIDISYIAGVCKDWEIYRGCEKLLDERGIDSRFDTTDKGNRILSAVSLESRRAWSSYQRAVVYLCITPAARQKIRGTGIGEGKQQDEMEVFKKKYQS